MRLDEILIYLRVLRKRLWLIALLTITTVGTIVFLQHTADPVYKVSVNFQVTAPPQSEVTLFENYRAPQLSDEISFIRQDFLATLTSRTVARQVIKKLDLRDVSASDIVSNLRTEQIEGSDFTRVTVFADSPQRAADIANALLEAALPQYGQLRARPATISKQFITRELEAVQQEVQQAEETLITLKIENRIGSLDQMIEEQQLLLRSLRFNRDEAWATGSLDIAQNYDQIITQREAELQDLVRLSTQYNSLQSNVLQLRSTYDFLLQKRTEAKLTENEALAVGFIQVLGEASPSSRAVSPYDIRILALGGMVSLALGVVIAFVWESITLTKASEEKQVDQEAKGTTAV